MLNDNLYAIKAVGERMLHQSGSSRNSEFGSGIQGSGVRNWITAQLGRLCPKIYLRISDKFFMNTRSVFSRKYTYEAKCGKILVGLHLAILKLFFNSYIGIQKWVTSKFDSLFIVRALSVAGPLNQQSWIHCLLICRIHLFTPIDWLIE